ncbi:MAG: vanadium-dependent haloperoxidase [Cyanobacteria bacterium P01_H01_bin.15]
MSDYRNQEALNVRIAAAKLAADRVQPIHKANPDEQRYTSANYPMSFTKGLKHDKDTGLIQEPLDFEAFRTAIDEGFIDPFTLSVRVASTKERAWEAPTAGVVYDLQGPDAQAVTMAPAPELGSKELAYEMAEVYELAILRDVLLTEFSDKTDANPDITQSIGRLNSVEYPVDGSQGRKRTTNPGPGITAGTLFRGSSPGVEVGPYLSQFLLIGNVGQTVFFSSDPDRPGLNASDQTAIAEGKIQYGALQIDQRVPVATPQNYMTKWTDWLDVQNGKDVRNNATLFDASESRRFMITPRDLATYVHDDALYEAYLNACLILLSMGTPFDPGFAKLSGQGKLFFNSLSSTNFPYFELHPRQAGGFALYGGPHILTLVTEVATRALKAVRFQKFNNHLRLRPEALAARVDRAQTIECEFPIMGRRFSELTEAIQQTVDKVKELNASSGNNTALLPMAFQEGSPMHPSYGAGHATVAGACVTILKAFFDTDAVFVRRTIKDKNTDTIVEVKDVFSRYQTEDVPDGQVFEDVAIEYTANDDGSALVPTTGKPFLTLEAELNKLAANISIGRNMAGVHYYSDYFDSLRMGEEIAIGILEEQALCYPTDPFVLSIPTFDGDIRRIGRR